MSNPIDLAKTALRLARKRGLTLRVERPPGGEPILHVGPKGQLTAWLRQALLRAKPEVIALLEAEPTRYVRVESSDGELVRALIDTHPCPRCGGNDRAATPDGQRTFCIPCMADEKVLQGELEQELLALRWGKTGTQEKESIMPANGVHSSHNQTSPQGACNTPEALTITPTIGA